MCFLSASTSEISRCVFFSDYLRENVSFGVCFCDFAVILFFFLLRKENLFNYEVQQNYFRFKKLFYQLVNGAMSNKITIKL